MHRQISIYSCGVHTNLFIQIKENPSFFFYPPPDRWSTVVPRVVELSKGPRPRDLVIEMEPLTPRHWRLQETSAVLLIRRQQRAISSSEITLQGTIWPISVLICTDFMCLLFRGSVVNITVSQCNKRTEHTETLDVQCLKELLIWKTPNLK